MASATLQHTSPTLPEDLRRPWPDDARVRWALRLGLALPLITLGVWANARGFQSSSHRAFEAQAAAVRAGGADLAGIGAAYPPMPTLLAGLVPGGPLGLSVVASLFAGCTLHLVWEQLVQRRLPRWVIVCLLLPLFAVPAVAYAASESVAGIALLSLLAVALHGFVRFTVFRDTEAGFVTGLALAAAFTFDPIAVFYTLALGAMTWFIAADRFRIEKSGIQATVAVLVFPTVFTVLAWMFLEWRFSGDVFSTLAADPTLLTFPEGVWPALAAAAKTVGMALLHVPLFLTVVAVYAVRRPLALGAYLVSVLASVVAVWIGLRYTPVTAYVLFTLMALLSVPRSRGKTGAAFVAVALAQLALAWVWPPTSPGFADWLAAVTAPINAPWPLSTG
jgi:hypothetical protein